MSDIPIKQSHISTMGAYHKATNNWENPIMALIFSDEMKAPHAQRNNEWFYEVEYFRGKIEE